VVRVGETLYVTQDFAHGLPTYSAQASADQAAASLNRLREQYGFAGIERLDSSEAQSSACAMAKAESLDLASPVAHYVIRYTTIEPNALPTSASRALADSSLRAYAIGSCYARTRTYPNGVYWMVLLFY